MRGSVKLFAFILFMPLLTLGQRSKIQQPPTFGIHFVLNDFKSSANIHSSSLGATLREGKFGRIRDMSPGLALNYIQGLSSSFDITITSAGSFLDYPKHDTIFSGNKDLLLEGDVSVRWRLLDNNYKASPYLQVGAGFSKYKGSWGAFIPGGVGVQVSLLNDLYVLVNAQYRLPVTQNTVSGHFFYGIGVAGIIARKTNHKQAVVHQLPHTVALPIDRDKDGVADSDDICPDIPGLAFFKGCPDMDEDGIPDREDSCPQVRGVARYKGCPVPDTDKDGVNDEEDKCLLVPGVFLLQGCPPPVVDANVPEIAEVVRKKINLAAKNIFFATGNYRLLSSSYAALDEVVNILAGDTSLYLYIEGHTDDIGETKANLVLSTNRAKAVYDYLLRKGIAEFRLRFVGYGEEKPLASNNDAEGRSRNRRVELMLSYKMKPLR